MDNLRTRLLALHLLETVLPSGGGGGGGFSPDAQEQKRVVEELLATLAEAMWAAPAAAALQQTRCREAQLDLQIQQLKATLPSTSASST